jgi:hypothetical protein
MKRRLDFVTNSSSSDYLLALYREKPEWEPPIGYISKAIEECKLTSVMSMFDTFKRWIGESLADDVYRSGMTDAIREKYYQLFLWNLFSDNSDGIYRMTLQDTADIFKKVENELREHTAPPYPMVPDRSPLSEQFLTYFEIYEREHMLEYLEATEKSEKTLTRWLENLTGCIWVLTCNWEDDDPPEGRVMSEKMGNCEYDLGEFEDE